MTIIHSSDLGWKAGQDISQEFAALAKTLKAGDTFVFDAMYDISGSGIDLAANVTLKGGVPGAGFNVTDTQTNSSALISLSDGNSLIDLTVTHQNSSTSRTQKVTFKVDADDVTIQNSSFSGNTGIFLDITGDDLLVEDTHFDGGFYQMRWLGDTNDFVVKNTLFENSLGDGIKTARGGGEGTKNATIIDSVFLNNHRDGIDTTGGFKDSSVIDSYFVGNGVSGMDIKTPIWEKADLSLNQTSRNVTITGSEFIDNGAGIVLTTNDRAQLLTDSNASKWLVQDIFINDTVFENHSSSNSVMVLSKGATGVYADNVTLLGNLHTYKTVEHNYIDHLNINVNTDLNISNSSTGNPRPGSLKIDYASMAGTDWSSTSSDGGSDPVVEDKNVALLGDGTSIGGVTTAGRALTIFADTKDGAPDIGSVRLKVPGFGSRMEHVEPYALFGDDGKGDLFGGKELDEGTYSVFMTAFSGRNGSGEILDEFTFDFTIGGSGSTPVVTPPTPVVTPPTPVDDDPVVDEPVVVAEPETDLEPDSNSPGPAVKMIDIKLINTATDNAVASIYQGAKLSNEDISGNKLTISAEALDPSSTNIGSMKLELDGRYTKVENTAPYALFGDNGKGNFFSGKMLDDGMHFATLTAYSGKNGKGSVLEKVTVNFEIGNYDSVLVNGLPATIGSYSAAQDSGTAKVSKDQSSVELDSNSWKTINISKVIDKNTVLNVDFKSDVEGEIHGIGFLNGEDSLETTFFQLDGSQTLGIQNLNGLYQTGSGFDTYSIPVGQHFTGEFDQIVLITDDDAELGASSVFDNLNFVDALA